jgi:hypothetical protein
MLADSKVKEVTFSAVVTRADGTVEDLGVIQYWHTNPIKRFLWKIKTWLLS